MSLWLTIVVSIAVVIGASLILFVVGYGIAGIIDDIKKL